VDNLTAVARYTPVVHGKIQVRSGTSVDPAAIEMILEAFDPGPYRVVNPRVGKDFTFSSQVLPGRYLLSAYANGERCTSVTVNGRPVGDALVPIESEDLNVTFDCAAVPTRLTVRAHDDRGNADSRARAVIFPADRQQWHGDDYRPLRLGFVRLSTSGVGEISNLPAGDYFVTAIPEAAGDGWRDPKTLDLLARTSTRITLEAGVVRAVDVVTVNLK
jgi:hypothetical protein